MQNLRLPALCMYVISGIERALLPWRIPTYVHLYVWTQRHAPSNF
jgi:hypothetical protein